MLQTEAIHPNELELDEEHQNFNTDLPADETRQFNFNSLEEVAALFAPTGEDWEIDFASTDSGALKKDIREWVYSGTDGKGQSLTESVAGKDGAERHNDILNNLYDKGWSVQEYFDTFSKNLVKEIYFADERGGISFQTYKFSKENPNFKNDYEETLDDDDYLRIQSSTFKVTDKNFNLDYIFGSDEKIPTPTEAKAEDSAWENFWKDLLNPRPKEQEVQGQPKGLFEIFGFRADLKDQNIQEKSTKPVSKPNPLNLFAQDSPAFISKENPMPGPAKAEEQIVTISDRPEHQKTEIIKPADKIEPITLIRPETAPLYIEVKETALAEQSTTVSFKEQLSPTIFEAEPLTSEQDLNDGQQAKETAQMVQAVDSGISLISSIASYQPKETSEYRPLKQATEPIAPLNSEQARPIKLIVADNLAVKPDKTEASPILADKKDEYRPESKNAQAEAQAEMPKAIIVEIVQKLEDVKILAVKPAELFKNPVLIKKEVSTIDSPPVVIPEFSLPRLSNGENVRDPLQSSDLDSGHFSVKASNFAKASSDRLKNSGMAQEAKTTAVPKPKAVIKSPEPNRIAIKPNRVDEAKALKEQVKALTKIMKAPAKVVELNELSMETKISRPVRTEAPALERTELLEKSDSAVILTALENLKGSGNGGQIQAENGRSSKEVVSISNYRARQAVIPQTKKVTAPKAIASAERLNRQTVVQTSQAAPSHNDELITDTLSGIRLTA